MIQASTEPLFHALTQSIASLRGWSEAIVYPKTIHVRISNETYCVASLVAEGRQAKRAGQAPPLRSGDAHLCSPSQKRYHPVPDREYASAWPSL